MNACEITINFRKESMASLRGSESSRKVDTAINSLLHLEEGDQASLLDVIEEYFTMPGSTTLSNSDSESEADQGEGTMQKREYTLLHSWGYT